MIFARLQGFRLFVRLAREIGASCAHMQIAGSPLGAAGNLVTGHCCPGNPPAYRVDRGGSSFAPSMSLGWRTQTVELSG
ncbi:MAG TPA: hypothetical protein IAC28_05405 [Candidatus Aphodovivens excrementavium]|nr:hypothetical protein [Candidatus Aphodovivens excrementavium]